VARTLPGFRLYDVGGYPGLVAQLDDRDGVIGEVWSVSEEGLRKLDRFEGVPDGLYRRVPVPLSGPFEGQVIEAYVYAGPVEGRPDIGSEWSEKQGGAT
jgi:gamma-glutamylcyclotransferase (GGCT)/AIG2-like uncharacterized protein YtfP